MSNIELASAVPVLPVQDIQKSVAFYRDQLGFTPAFEFGPYAGVQRGNIEIHLDGGQPNPYAGPACCRINVTGVDALYAEIEPRGVVKPDETLATLPHGMRQFSIVDPTGNRITFAEPA